MILIGIMAIWFEFYVTPGTYNSWRYTLHLSRKHVDSLSQISYMLNHNIKALDSIFNVFYNLDIDLRVESTFSTKFVSVYMMFMGIIYLLYPVEKISHKTKIGAILVFFMVYFAASIMNILTWNKIGYLYSNIPASYFFPLLGLIPIALGINHIQTDTTEIDYYIVMLTVVFIIFRLLTLTLKVY